MSESPHIPVLYREVVDAFASHSSGTVIDCTLGYGGHTSLLLEHYPHLFVIGIDQDETAIRYSSDKLARFGERFSLRKGRFSAVLPQLFRELPNGTVCGVLADIGVSSLQLDHHERGFSFHGEVLDMRMDQSATLTAAEVVNSYSHADLVKVLEEYGEIRSASKLADAIVRHRPYSTMPELLRAVSAHLPKQKKIHPATLLLQAIRIEVNDELGELRRLLDAIENAPPAGATIAIISFHSLEDRIVKQRFAAWARSCICPPEAMRCTCGNNHALGRVVSKKPIMAEPDEIKQNPRSRSAKLRIFQMESV